MAAVPTTTDSVEHKLAHMSIEKPTAPPTNGEATNKSSAAASIRKRPAGPLKTPIVDPIEGFAPPPTPELTAEQQNKYDQLLEIVKSWKEIPSTQGKEGPLTESEIMWLTRECLLRYLRATKWVVQDATKRLLSTLTWRREYGVEGLTGEYISEENETGKQVIVGFDIAGRPCQYLNPGKQNTGPSPRQIQHLVFMLERSLDLMIPGQETLALLINFKSSGTRTNTAPGLGQARIALSILQDHYPERLGRALIINIPWIVNGFFKLITPFIDPMTRVKLKFNDDMRQHVPPQQLLTDFHGDLEFVYEHGVYWPALLSLCEERHAEQVARWEKAGKHYGESEVYLKGGNEGSVAGSSVGTVAPSMAETSVAEKVLEKAGDGSMTDKEKENVDSALETKAAQPNGSEADQKLVEPTGGNPVVATEVEKA